MNRLGAFSWLMIVLAVIGAINWGLVGFFEYDLVAALFGEMSGASRVIYSIVGLAGLYTLAAVTSVTGQRHESGAV